MKYNLLLLFSISLFVGCGEKIHRSPTGHLFAQFNNSVGQKITVQGILRHDFDARPYLETPKGHIWLDGVKIANEQYGNTIEAEGIVQIHRDLPIVTTPGKHGILLPDGATVDEAKIRFSLKNTSYKVIKK